MNPKRPENESASSSTGTLIGVGLCILLYLGWTQYLKSKYPTYNTPKQVASEEIVEPQAAGVPSDPSAPVSADPKRDNQPIMEAKAPEVPRMPLEDLVFDTPDARFTFNQDTASLVSVLLKQYRETNSPDSAFVELLHRPLIIQPTQGGLTTKPLPVVYSGKRTEDGVSFSRTEGPWTITQEWIVPKSGYVGKLTSSWTNTSAESRNLAPVVLMEMGAKSPKTSSSMFIPGVPNEAPRILTQFDGTDDFYNIDGFCKDQTKVVALENKKLDFFGFDHHYFAAAFVPSSSAAYKFVYSSLVNDVCSVIGSISTDFGAVAPNQSATMSWDFWTGPKEVELLTAFNPHLRTTLGLGWLDMIAHPLLLAIKGFYKFTGNHGIAIILLTLVLKILFYPLARQAAVSAAKMKKLNPEMTKLREKYKADPQKMQMELMKFMSQNKINPMKGCLPMLPTIPVFFALFRVLSASIDLRHAPFYLWIHDLSAMDPYYVSPIILTGLMFLQQKLTPMTGMDPTQEKVMMMMPLIFGVMMISLPSGLVLYMLTNTIVTIAQQHYFNQKFAETI